MISRRDFLSAATACAAAVMTHKQAVAAADQAETKIPLGVDNFAVRGMRWKADQLIDYAASLKLDSLLISDLDAFESHDDSYLKQVRQHADDAGIGLHVGTWSICPTSLSFRNTWGTAEEHLALGIRIATALGSPVLRVILGNGKDRSTPGGIQARIADTVKVLKSQRSRAVDSGVKIAMENHAGDMQAHEVVQLIEAAGKDFVGANLDSGNATWTMERPLDNLEIMGPYALTTSLRDSAIWESDNGATIQWTAMGDGDVDLKAYFQRFAQLCPGVPVHIETISGFNREIPYFQPDFWNVWPNASAKGLAQFIALAKKGKPRAAHPPFANPQEEQAYQKDQVARSIAYCRALGLGSKT